MRERSKVPRDADGKMNKKVPVAWLWHNARFIGFVVERGWE